MAEQDAVAIAEAMWDRLAAEDWDGVRALLHDDYVQEWPQSGERIEGPEDAIAINRQLPRRDADDAQAPVGSGPGDLAVLRDRAHLCGRQPCTRA